MRIGLNKELILMNESEELSRIDMIDFPKEAIALLKEDNYKLDTLRKYNHLLKLSLECKDTLENLLMSQEDNFVYCLYTIYNVLNGDPLLEYVFDDNQTCYIGEIPKDCELVNNLHKFLQQSGGLTLDTFESELENFKQLTNT
jgi:hypothetical protein